MIDKDGIAVEEVVANQDHLAGGGGFDRGAGSDGEIEPGVGIALLTIEETAQAKRARQRAIDRLVEHQIARLVGTKGLISTCLFGQFTVDAGHVFGERIDLTAVF